MGFRTDFVSRWRSLVGGLHPDWQTTSSLTLRRFQIALAGLSHKHPGIDHLQRADAEGADAGLDPIDLHPVGLAPPAVGGLELGRIDPQQTKVRRKVIARGPGMLLDHGTGLLALPPLARLMPDMLLHRSRRTGGTFWTTAFGRHRPDLSKRDSRSARWLTAILLTKGGPVVKRYSLMWMQGWPTLPRRKPNRP